MPLYKAVFRIAFALIIIAGHLSLAESPTTAPASRPAAGIDQDKLIAVYAQVGLQSLAESLQTIAQAEIPAALRGPVADEFRKRNADLEQVRTDYIAKKITYNEAFPRIKAILDLWPSIEGIVGRDEFVKIARIQKSKRRDEGPRNNFRNSNESLMLAFDRTHPSVVQMKQFGDLFNNATEEFGSLAESLKNAGEDDRKTKLIEGTEKIFLKMQEGIKATLTDEQFKEFIKQLEDERRRWATDK